MPAACCGRGEQPSGLLPFCFIQLEQQLDVHLLQVARCCPCGCVGIDEHPRRALWLWAALLRIHCSSTLAAVCLSCCCNKPTHCSSVPLNKLQDTSNEVGGDGDIPHPGLGRARRMQVRSGVHSEPVPRLSLVRDYCEQLTTRWCKPVC